MLIKSEDILKSIGKKIKKARLAKGYTQEALSEKIDISTDLLRNIENSRNIGSLPTLLNLCNTLEITPNFLFADLLSTDISDYDNNLFSLFGKITPDNKEILKQIIIYLDKKY
ncbi:MAG: helix-turn-helix transcriptional regulator [Clostridia bacterium]|nr:helix-turn-helix transcriptional regulator [Clostridia bacterium]